MCVFMCVRVCRSGSQTSVSVYLFVVHTQVHACPKLVCISGLSHTLRNVHEYRLCGTWT